MSDASSQARGEWRTHAWLVALATTALLLLLLVLLWDWNWFKGPVERRVTAATGREFKIGHLDVDLGRVIVIRVGDVSLANTSWSLTPEMARADLLRVEVPLGALLRGERVLRRTDVVRPALLLERNRRGTANWRFGAKRTPARRTEWTFGEVRIHDGRLDVRDAPLGTRLSLTVDSATPQADAESVRLLFRGTGRYRSQPFRLDGWADSPVALLARQDAAFRLDVSARAGATRGRVHGALKVPFNPNHLQVNAELKGDDLGDLYPLLGVAMPTSPPYRIAGRLRRDAQVVSLLQMRGRVGDSDVTGDVTFDFGADKPMLRADVASSNLDLDDLGGFIGLPPSATEGESASAKQREEAARRAASPTLLPDRDYDLHKLNSMNARVHLHADRVDAGKWPIESFAMRLRLEDALVQVDPLDVGLAHGRLTGKIQLDARQGKIVSSADVGFRGIDLEALFPRMQPPNVGHLNGRVDLQGTGNSVADMLGTADGEAQFGMGQGRVSNLLLELAGLDVAETLKFLVGKDRTVRVRCAYADFDFDAGTMEARSLVFDTTDTVVFGKGTIDLEAEKLALEIRPEPKDVSPVSLRGPLEIGGTLKDPEVSPKAKPLLGRAVAAAALYAIAPPAALLALIETGPGEDVDCHGVGGVSRPRVDTAEADQKRDDEADDSKPDEPPEPKAPKHPLR
jgi:uncharacterized protein involved in outer membrane biogenesis